MAFNTEGNIEMQGIEEKHIASSSRLKKLLAERYTEIFNTGVPFIPIHIRALRTIQHLKV